MFLLSFRIFSPDVRIGSIHRRRRHPPSTYTNPVTVFIVGQDPRPDAVKSEFRLIPNDFCDTLGDFIDLTQSSPVKFVTDALSRAQTSSSRASRRASVKSDSIDAASAPLSAPGVCPRAVLPSASSEQAQVIDSVLAGKHVIVNSVAGSGKTTTVLLLAKQKERELRASKTKILLLTYNARLKTETRLRCERLQLQVYTVVFSVSFAILFESEKESDPAVLQFFICCFFRMYLKSTLTMHVASSTTTRIVFTILIRLCRTTSPRSQKCL